MYLALLGGIADGVEEHEVLVDVLNAIFFHHRLLQLLAHHFGLALNHSQMCSVSACVFVFRVS
jgi:hypothetical protein